MRKTLLYILLVGILFVFGCSADSRSDYIVNNGRLTAATNICTVVVPSVSADKKLAMVAAVSAGDNCDKRWFDYLIDPDNNIPPDMSCVTDAIVELLLLADANEPITAEEIPEEITDEMLIAARNRLVLAVERFRQAMLLYGIKE